MAGLRLRENGGWCQICVRLLQELRVHKPSVAAGLWRALFDFAVARGADPQALAQKFDGLPGTDAALDDRIPFDQYVMLMGAAKRLTGDPALALHFGEQVELSSFSVVGLLGPPAGSVDGIVDYFNRFVRLLVDLPASPTDRLQLVRRGPAVWLLDTRANPNHFPELTESMFARLVSSARRMGIAKPIARLHVTHARPAHYREYERLFGVPVSFGAGGNAVELGQELLKLLPASASTTYAQQLAVSHAQALLSKLDDTRSLKGRVAAVIAASLGGAAPSANEVAKAMGVSRQTLYRRLKSEGLTLKRLRDEFRLELALGLLEDGATIAEVGHQVGFSDRAAFSRAFKRWTGRSPGKRRGFNPVQGKPSAAS